MKTKVEAEYVERFQIGTYNASITNRWFSEKGFKPFVGGCGIGMAQKNVEQARKIIFDYVRGDIVRKVANHNASIEALIKLEASLGEDVFNLGQFKAKATT